jgi:hypothetical protein
LVTKFNPVLGIIIQTAGGRGKREMGGLMAFPTRLCTQIVVKSPHCRSTFPVLAMAIRNSSKS